MSYNQHSIIALSLCLPLTIHAKEQQTSSTKKNYRLEKFDKNNNGKLDDDEKKTAFKVNSKLKIEFIKKHDTDDDDKLSDKEFQSVKRTLWKKALSLFDTDKNGKLTGEESNRRNDWIHTKHPGYYPFIYMTKEIK